MTFEYTAEHILILSCICLVLVPSVRYSCSQSNVVEISGADITDIPRNLRSDVEVLSMSKTNIDTLNLTAAADYPILCRLEISSSPVKLIITPTISQTLALTRLRLAAGQFPTPPGLGRLLEGQLVMLSLNGIGIITIPDGYFQNYTSLTSLSLTGNPISDLNAANLAGLHDLQSFYLGNTQLNPMPLLHLWLPKLRRLHVPTTGITTLSATLVESLPFLRYLDLTNNQLSTLPGQEHYANLKNMNFIKLNGNPLSCDFRLCWIKVTRTTDLKVNNCVTTPVF